MDKQREAFEAWRNGNTVREEDGRYSSMETELMWVSWQAATAAERERCATLAKNIADHCEANDSPYGANAAEDVHDAIREG